MGNTKLPKPATQGTVVGDIARKHLGITFTIVTGLYSAASHSAHQPADYAGWFELLRYCLMPLGDLARRRSPCSHRLSMAMPLIPPCRDHSITKSALSSGCLPASRPHTRGSFRRWHIRSRCAQFDARSSIKPSVLASLGGIDAASPMAHSSHCVHPGTAPQAQSHKTIILWMGLQRGGGQRKTEVVVINYLSFYSLCPR